MKIKTAVEAITKRVGFEVNAIELDNLTELELLPIMSTLLEIALNMERTEYYAQMNSERKFQREQDAILRKQQNQKTIKNG